MATPSLIKAVLEKYATLTASGFPSSTRPAIAFGEQPQVDGSGAQLTAESGYIVLRQESADVKPLAFGRVTNETHELVWEIFYPSVADGLSAASAIRFNGGTPEQKAGFDGGTLPTLTGVTVRDILCTRPVVSQEGIGKTGKVIHCVRVYHRVCLTRSS